MKVVFLEQVEGTAYPGEVKDVADGFARNYLLPRKLAVPATPGSMQRAESLSKKEDRRQAKLDEDARVTLAKLEGKVLTFEERVGEQGRLYGSVTVLDIAEALAAAGQQVDRRLIHLPEPIKALGSYEVELRLHRDVVAKIKVDVAAE